MNYRKLLMNYLPLALVITLLSGLVYGASQQVLRQSANDPQIQLASDAARALDQGAKPEEVAGKDVDVAASLDPAMLIYNHNGQLLASSLLSDGVTPTYPAGAQKYAKSHGRDVITWQLPGSVRLAAVAVASGSSQGDVVVVARSLREVEQRENLLLVEVAIGWFITLVAGLVATWLIRRWE